MKQTFTRRKRIRPVVLSRWRNAVVRKQQVEPEESFKPGYGGHQAGLMLVELVIALSLLGLVLGLGYLYFSFTATTYARGEEKAIAQQAVRHASDHITTEIRYAREVEINPATEQNGADYRYIFEENGSIKSLDENSFTRVLADSATDGMVYSLLLIGPETDRSIIPAAYIDAVPENIPDDLLFFIIAAKNTVDNKEVYSLVSSVQALNLSIFSSTVTTNTGNGKMVKYDKVRPLTY